jgi:uncharacterized RDD family membrane protein YckC
MESVRIETAHNVALQMEVATIVDRGLAVLIDWLVLAGWSIAVGQLFNALDLAMPDWLGVVLFAIPWTFYHLLCEVLMDGQSIGKRARNIKVVRLDGAQPGIGNYLLRWVLRLVDTLFFLGAVVILFNGKGQRIGDLAAGTTVISLKRRFSMADTLGMDLPADHRVTFPDADRLTDLQARLIKDVLANGSAARAAALEKLVLRFRPDHPQAQDLPPEAFLRTLLLDHLFLTGR